MTRRTTLFIVCAFEMALILFVAAWTALAEQKQYTYPPANVRHLYEICSASDDLNAVYCVEHLDGILESLSMNCVYEKNFPAEDILVPTVNICRQQTLWQSSQHRNSQTLHLCRQS